MKIINTPTVFDDDVKQFMANQRKEVKFKVNKEYKEDVFNTSFHPMNHKSKPSHTDIKGMARNFNPTEVTLIDFCNKINDGQTFTPAILKDSHRKDSNFISSQIIAFDFDDNENPIKKIFEIEQYGLKVNMFYNTFSHTESFNKFRLICVLDKPFSDKGLYKKILKSIVDKVKSDRACKDVSRMFFAGTNAQIFYPYINKMDDFIGYADTLINADVRHQNKRRNTTKLKNDSNNAMPYDIYSVVENESKTPFYRTFNYESAISKSKVFKGFAEDTIWLNHGELFNLATNMRFVEGGYKWMKERMRTSQFDYDNNNFGVFYSANHYNYEPQRIIDFDYDLKDKYHNVLSLGTELNNKFVYQVRNINPEPVDVIAERMKEQFDNSLKSVNRISILVTPMGTGKTEHVINTPNIIFALPNHKLKDEVAERMKAKGLPFVTTPKPPVFFTDSLNEKYNKLQESGESSLASSIIHKVALNTVISNVDYVDIDIQIAKDYLNALKRAYNATVTVLTTHSRVMLASNSFNNKEIFVSDEDLIDEIMKINSIKEGFLNRVLESLKDDEDVKDEVKKVRDFLNSIEPNQIKEIDIKFDNKALFIERLANKESSQRLIALLNSTQVSRIVNSESVSEFYFGKVTQIPSVFKKVVILSGTADKSFYTDLLKDKEKFDYFHSGFAQNIKPIEQDLSKSYSRTSLNRDEKPQFNEERFTPITYKKYKDKFEQESDMHFGNVSGIDTAKGKDIACIGTPIEPTEITLLRASLLGCDIEDSSRGMVSIKTDFFEFVKFSFNNPTLARIETTIAESEIRQTATRGRTTRTESKTIIFSAIPIPEADIFKGKDFVKRIDNDLESLSTPFKKIFDLDDVLNNDRDYELDELMGATFYSLKDISFINGIATNTTEGAIELDYSQHKDLIVGDDMDLMNMLNQACFECDLTIRKHINKTMDLGSTVMCKPKAFSVDKVSDIDFSYLEGVEPYNWKK